MNEQHEWYLGIDFGTSGISAVLCNYTLSKQYPIYWTIDQENSITSTFRLPCRVYFHSDLHIPIAVGVSYDQGILIQNFKPLLQFTIPEYTESEPLIMSGDNQSIPLSWLNIALTTLLKSINPLNINQKYLYSPGIFPVASALGLDEIEFPEAINSLTGVICSCPANWGDLYRFNLRESIKKAQLMNRTEQIFFIEESIAPLLTKLPIIPNNSQPTKLSNKSSIKGGTLIINAGATNTELAILALPDELSSLNYDHFTVGSIPYAGLGLDQDIINLLLLQLDIPTESIDYHLPEESLLNLAQKRSPFAPPDPNNLISSLSLSDRLQYQLELDYLPTGTYLKQVAESVKMILPCLRQATLTDSKMTWELDGIQWGIQRKSLDYLVLLPYIRAINQLSNHLLAQSGLYRDEIKQVICCGGTSVLGAIGWWIQHKFPTASVIDDSAETHLVAMGLSNLAFYPNVLNHVKHQYSDTFLLKEMLKIFQYESELDFKEVISRLENRGIHTQSCLLTIRNILDGQVPSGILPHSDYGELFNNPYDFSLDEMIPFNKHNNLYRLNIEPFARWNDYFHKLIKLSGNFKEPLVAEIGSDLNL